MTMSPDGKRESLNFKLQGETEALGPLSPHRWFPVELRRQRYYLPACACVDQQVSTVCDRCLGARVCAQPGGRDWRGVQRTQYGRAASRCHGPPQGAHACASLRSVLPSLCAYRAVDLTINVDVTINVDRMPGDVPLARLVIIHCYCFGPHSWVSARHRAVSHEAQCGAGSVRSADGS
jgi:hypothetical protein